ncbi:OmpA family protein [Elioraea thermophila]|uniref:OmpA family protein n=1 Tax=Elioraea thermophila TaxID=2185104 RepID=UPI000DF1F0BB|nr:OmpA family protein [Elioraea thermophila]
MRSPAAERRLVLLGLGALAACASPTTRQIAGLETRGIVLTVNFDLNSYAIRPDARPLLDTLADAMTDPRLSRHRYEINGHTDSTGRLARNLALSELRAAAVVDYLAAKGVPRDRMRAQGFGPLQPLDPANPRDPANRRVEVFAIPPPE